MEKKKKIALIIASLLVVCVLGTAVVKLILPAGGNIIVPVYKMGDGELFGSVGLSDIDVSDDMKHSTYGILVGYEYAGGGSGSASIENFTDGQTVSFDKYFKPVRVVAEIYRRETNEDYTDNRASLKLVYSYELPTTEFTWNYGDLLTTLQWRDAEMENIDGDVTYQCVLSEDCEKQFYDSQVNFHYLRNGEWDEYYYYTASINVYQE